MDFALGPMQPDRGLVAPMVVNATNVLPILDGYGPYPSLYTPLTAEALPSAPRGVFSVVLNTGAWRAYEFTDAELYELQADYTLDLIQGGFSCPLGYDWSAIHFGTKLLFTNANDGLQSYDVEAGGAVVAIPDAGDPAYIFTCANFVVGLNCLDSLGNRNIRLIRTSGFNDQTNWTSDGADYQELADGEQLLCGFDLKENTALLVQSRALVLMQFGNAPGGAQFSLRKIADGKGAVSAKACTSFDGMTFMLATDDFYLFSLGTGLVPIGADEIAQTFLKLVDQSQFALVQAAVDPLKKVVMWRFKRSSDVSTTVSSIEIGYEWHLKRWFWVTEPTAYLTRLATVAVTYNAVTGTYDSQTLQYDDLFWQGSAPLFGALDADYKFALWTGPSLEGQITTRIANSGISGKILWATLIGDVLAPQIELGTSDSLGTAITWQPAETANDDGRIPLEGRGLNIQFRLTIPYGDMGANNDGWTFVNAISHVSGSQQGPK